MRDRAAPGDSASAPLGRLPTAEGWACRKRSPMFCPRAPPGTASSVAPMSRAATAARMTLEPLRCSCLDAIIDDDLRSVLAHQAVFSEDVVVRAAWPHVTRPFFVYSSRPR